MVNPFYILAVGLGLGFLLGLAGKKQAVLSNLLVLLAMTFFTAVSALWVQGFLSGTFQTTMFFSAGFKPPFSISLMIGLHEAFISLMVNVLGLLSVIFLRKSFLGESKPLGAVMLVLFMGLNMIIFTRDLFNIFVFLEITAISVSGLILLDDKHQAHAAGFKYLLASSLISAFYLLGAVLTYYSTGTLYLNDILAMQSTLSPMALIAVFLLIIAVILELKPFPANGWALDVYQAANPGIGAIVSGAVGTAMIFLLYKLMPAASFISDILVTIGMVTFIASNLLSLAQKNANRLFGYSSIGQIGLIISIIGMQSLLGDKLVFIAFTILLTHFFAKAGLFWLSGIIGRENLKDWAVLRRRPILLVLFGTFIFALIGFPPFPSFYGKWELIMNLSATHQYYLIISVLTGSFLEGIYLFRWLGYAIKLDFDDLPEFKLSWEKLIPVCLFGLLLYAAGIFTSTRMDGLKGLDYLPLIFIAVLYFIDWLPIYIKNTIVIAGMVFYSWHILPGLYATDLMRFIFATIFLAGGTLTLIAGYAYKGKREGFYPVALLMYAGLAMIIQATTTLEFFFGWELMTAGSYFLIIRGKKSMPHGLSYMLFSIAGAYAILAGFGLIYGQTGSLALSSLNQVTSLITVIFALLAIGFMTKTASLGLHIWLPGAHAEAESDVSPMVSAILLKAGVFGLLILMIAMGHSPETSNITYILGWVGALTALIGNLAAAFQEDAKRLLAYSSIAQLGYILFGLAMMSHLGWMTAMVFSINHFLYKAILFLTIGAVVLKVGTHSMFKMGGLIKNMPMAFIAVLIGIIALSGVPPLSGFSAKWLLYNAVLDKHWYFQGAIVFFSGIIAFLYLFKLIYSVFLGQLKDNLRHVTDISIWFAIPIYTLIIGIMIFSAKPEWVLVPLGNMIAQWHPNGGLTWSGGMATAPFGYWYGTAVMVTIGIMFVSLLSWLLILSRKAVKVSQFNIVYSAEAPQRPETTHMSYNIYAGYNKALGWLVAPKITEFWETISDWVHSLAIYGRHIYGGNGQVYLMYIMAYFLTIYFLIF